MSEWQERALEECLATLIDYRGKSPKKSHSGIPVISAKVVKDGRIVHPVEQTIAPSYYSEWMRRGLPCTGDVVLTTEGPLGEVAQLDPKTARYALGQRIVVLRGKEDVLDNTFLKFLLQSTVAQHRLHSYATGTTVAGISQKSLRRVPLPVPPIGEQRAIAELLGSLDDKIELNRRMNETLEAMAQAIFRDWFVDFGPTRRKLDSATDPVEIMGGLVADPDRARELANLFPARLGDDGLPEGWDMRPFSDFVQIVGGGTPKTSVEAFWNGSIPWFSIVDTPAPGSVFVHETEKSITEQGVDGSSARLVDAGTTIISARGTVGNLAMAAKSMTFNQSCYGLKGRNGAGDCFVFMASQHLVDRLRSMAHGSVFSTITRQTFESVQQCDPTPALFAAYEELTGPLFAKINVNGQQNAALAATRDLLLPKLMSGQIRLCNTGKAAEVAA